MELVGNMCVGGLVVDVYSIFQAFVAEGWRVVVVGGAYVDVFFRHNNYIAKHICNIYIRAYTITMWSCFLS